MINEIIETTSNGIQKTSVSERSMTLTLVVIFIVSIGFLIRYNGESTSKMVDKFTISVDKNTSILEKNTVVMTEVKEILRNK